MLLVKDTTFKNSIETVSINDSIAMLDTKEAQRQN
jgi:hypothetical protein